MYFASLAVREAGVPTTSSDDTCPQRVQHFASYGSSFLNTSVLVI